MRRPGADCLVVVMKRGNAVERSEQVIAVEIGSTGNGRSPIFNGRRQPSSGGTSRMMREYQVRICEGLGVKIPGSARPPRIHGELLKLGFEVAQSSVAKYMVKRRGHPARDGEPSCVSTRR